MYRLQIPGCVTRPRRTKTGERKERKRGFAFHTTKEKMPTDKRQCGDRDCDKRATYDQVGSKKPERCSAHAEDGMVVVNKKCGHRDCYRQPAYGKAGSNKAERCAAYAEDGMVIVVSKRCGHRDCNPQPS